jgi:hypothetical protein
VAVGHLRQKIALGGSLSDEERFGRHAFSDQYGCLGFESSATRGDSSRDGKMVPCASNQVG